MAIDTQSDDYLPCESHVTNKCQKTNIGNM